MVHERLGIKNNRIDLSEVPGISKELKVIGSFEINSVFFCTYKVCCGSHRVTLHYLMSALDVSIVHCILNLSLKNILEACCRMHGTPIHMQT